MEATEAFGARFLFRGRPQKLGLALLSVKTDGERRSYRVASERDALSRLKL